MPNPATNLAAPWRLTAREASRAMAEGSLTCDALARSYLDRIAGREFELSAWAFVDPGHVVRQAWELDKLPRRSPLHGVPISIKDMVDTAESQPATIQICSLGIVHLWMLPWWGSARHRGQSAAPWVPRSRGRSQKTAFLSPAIAIRRRHKSCAMGRGSRQRPPRNGLGCSSRLTRRDPGRDDEHGKEPHHNGYRRFHSHW